MFEGLRLENVDIFYGHLKYITDIGDILWPFVFIRYIFPVWVSCTKKSGNPVQKPGLHQGCQMVYFKTKNLKLGIFWRALEWKMLVYFAAVWYNFLPIGTIYDR
jgi:hypothetical protein